METGGIKLEFELTKTKHDDENENPITWVKWYDGVKAVGDVFTIKADRISFKEESQPVFFVIDEEANEGISVFAAHHPNATFTDATPHGIRLANAIGRAFDLDGKVGSEDLCDAVNNHDGTTIEVKKTEKGVLWTVNL